MLIELGLMTLGYCLIVKPAYAALCGFLKGKFESDIALAPRREKVIAEAERLQRHFDATTHYFTKAEQQYKKQQEQQEFVAKKRKKKKKKKHKETYDIEIVPNESRVILGSSDRETS